MRSGLHQVAPVDIHIASAEAVADSEQTDIQCIGAQVVGDCTVSYIAFVATVRMKVGAAILAVESSSETSRHTDLLDRWCCAAGYRDR